MTIILVTIFISLYLLIGILFFGSKLPAYSHLRDTISELGEKRSSFETQVGYGVFLPVALLLILSSSVLYFQGFENDLQKNLSGLLACVGIGYMLATFFPCDPGSPTSGGVRQQIHNIGGFVEYAGGAYFIFQASESVPLLSTIGYIVVVCTIVITISAFWRGLVQRVAEIGLFGTIIYVSILIWTA
jgi:hypothetical protein